MLQCRRNLVIREIFISKFAFSLMENFICLAKFLVKMCLFICKFSIRSSKERDVSTGNNAVPPAVNFINILAPKYWVWNFLAPKILKILPEKCALNVDEIDTCSENNNKAKAKLKSVWCRTYAKRNIQFLDPNFFQWMMANREF